MTRSLSSLGPRHQRLGHHSRVHCRSHREVHGGTERVTGVRVEVPVSIVAHRQRTASDVDLGRRPWSGRPAAQGLAQSWRALGRRPAPRRQRHWADVGVRVILDPAHQACLPAQGIGDGRRWNGGRANACFGHGVVRCRKNSRTGATDNLI